MAASLRTVVTAGTIVTSEGTWTGADRSLPGSAEVASLGGPDPETSHPIPDSDDSDADKHGRSPPPVDPTPASLGSGPRAPGLG